MKSVDGDVMPVGTPEPDFSGYEEHQSNFGTQELPNIEVEVEDTEPSPFIQGETQDLSQYTPQDLSQGPAQDLTQNVAEKATQDVIQDASQGSPHPTSVSMVEAPGPQEPIRSLLKTKKPKPKPKMTPERMAQMFQLQRDIIKVSQGRTINGTGDIFSNFEQSGSTQDAQPYLNKVNTAPMSTTTENDSNAWMHEDVDIHGSAASEFANLSQAYKRKQGAEETTMEDDINFLRANNREKTRLELLNSEFGHTDARIEQPDIDLQDELFVGPNEASSSSKRSYPVIVGSDQESAHQEESVAKRPKQTRRRRSQKEKDFDESLENALEPEKEKKRRRKPVSKEGGPPKQKSVRKSKAKDGVTKKATKPKGLPRGKRNMMRISSLYGNSIYEDAKANALKPSAPIMSAHKKDEAIKQLVSSVPEGKDTGSAASERRNILQATKILGNYKVKPTPDGKWSFKGMTAHLHHHQVQGAAWMKEKEVSLDEPRGGFCSDAMGLGKTIMTLACMIANPPKENDGCKTTLIVASPSLIGQWMSEIEKHVEPKVLGTVLRYHTGSRIEGPDAITILGNIGVILTTYGEVLRSFPKAGPPAELVSQQHRHEWRLKQWEEQRGVLHRLSFYRIVLDEAQAIKSYIAKTTIACRALTAQHRWLVTGTPLQNTPDELYSYFRFLRMKKIGSYDVFKENFRHPDSKDICNDRIHAMLHRVMLRRTHADTLFGAPLIKLPDTYERTITVDFSPVERQIYEIIRMRFAQRINQYQSQGLGMQSYRNILVLLLRLRQLTSHVFLIQDTISDLFAAEDIQRLWDATSWEANGSNDRERKQNQNMLSQMRKMILEKENLTPASTQAEYTPTADQEAEEADLEKSRPLVFKFRRILRTLAESSKWDAIESRKLCHKCRDLAVEPYITDCLHLYCYECLTAMQYEAASNDEDNARCLECGSQYKTTNPCNGLKELSAEDPVLNPEDETPARSRRRHTSPDSDLKWATLEGAMMPSAKTAALTVRIEEWLKEDPKAKIIIFTQFHMMIKIVSKICTERAWGSCLYHGKMDFRARERSIKTFGDDPSKSILISSLKTGGVGLNLTMASRVVSIDLWWNSSVEQQAFCRVYRIGQTRETYITRIVVRNSVDEKLQLMQERKKEAIEAAMGDDGQREAKVTLTELLRLFGTVRTDDETHREFIVVEDEEEEDFCAPEMPGSH